MVLDGSAVVATLGGWFGLLRHAVIIFLVGALLGVVVGFWMATPADNNVTQSEYHVSS